MPQMRFWAQSHPVRFRFTYSVDPTSPGDNPTIHTDVLDQGGRVMGAAGAHVFGPHLDEWVGDAMQAAWLTYLYGDPENLPLSVGQVCTAWRKFTKNGVHLDR